MSKTVIIVAGPTASGKTTAAIDLALQHQTSVISADSRQCYREMKIGVARPSEAELQTVPHYFIATHSVHDNVSAASFETYALDVCNQLFQNNDVVVMTGGTGLYIKAFCEGLDEIPAIDPELREELMKDYKLKGLDWLRNEVQITDPVFFQDGENHNPRRLMRALEVIRSTGRSVLEFRKGEKKVRDFEIKKVGIDPGRDELVKRIDHRVDQMMKDGLLDEVKSLYRFNHLPALQTVGYQELFDHLDGKSSIEAAVERIKINTRQYAKRQRTWFRKENFFS